MKLPKKGYSNNKSLIYYNVFIDTKFICINIKCLLSSYLKTHSIKNLIFEYIILKYESYYQVTIISKTNNYLPY